MFAERNSNHGGLLRKAPLSRGGCCVGSSPMARPQGSSQPPRGGTCFPYAQGLTPGHPRPSCGRLSDEGTDWVFPPLIQGCWDKKLFGLKSGERSIQEAVA